MKYFSLLLFCSLCLLDIVLCQEYTIITPKAFRIGATETVILNLHGYTGATVSSFSFILPSREQQIDHLERPLVLNQQQTEAPIEIPVRIPSRAFDNIDVRNTQFIEFHVEVTGSNNDFEATVQVLLSKESGYLFIVTNRPTYRPSETVTFSLFPLRQRMAPEREVLFQVIIRTPDGIGVFRTQPRLLSQQVKPYSDQYELPDYPEIGIWIIEAIYTHEGFETSQQTTFKVDRYVLPTFQVNIEPAKSFFLLSDNKFDFVVNAEYSYGVKVGGSVFVSVLLKKQENSDVTVEIYKMPSSILAETTFSNGRRAFSVPLRNIHNQLAPGESLESISANGGSLIVEAAVNGFAEGVIEKTTSNEVPFIKSPFKIDLSRLSGFYTPTIIYDMQFDILDSVSNTPLQVTLDITCNGIVTPTSSNEGGQVNFQCLFIGSGPQDVRIVTTDPGIDVADQASVDLVIEPYISPSQSYLQVEIDPILTVGQPNVFINFRYNRNPGNIRYQILARGTIVASGVKQTEPGSTEVSEQIQITNEMVPSGRIVAYYLYEGGSSPEVVSNSKWFDVVDQCKDEVTVNVAENEILPGGSINIDVSGTPGGSVTVIGVDRAAYFIYNKGRLTRETMFNKMESYDQGCVRTGGRDSQSVFERAGVLMTTPRDIPFVDTLLCERSQRKKRQTNYIEEPGLELLEQIRLQEVSKCKRDGSRRYPTTETCFERFERVLLNAEYTQFYPECGPDYLAECLNIEAIHQAGLDIGLSGGRSAGSEDADIQALVDLSPRSNFQESIIFTNRDLNAEGRASFQTKAKDSITFNDIDAIGMSNENDGFCISKPEEVRVFKKIFIQIFTPYSLKEQEQAQIRIAVFNYDDIEISGLRIQVQHDTTFCSSFVGEDFSTFADFDIPADRAFSANIALLPIANGVGTITMRVVDVRREVVLDTITKTIIVEPPGEIKYIEGTEVIDLSLEVAEDQEFDFEFAIQDIFTPGTRKCWIYAYANLLGPSIEIDPITKQPNNVADLFRIPRGCGEQNMLRTGPNVYVHGYMESVGLIPVGSEVYVESLKLMKAGFDRELSYRTNRVPGRPWSVFAHYNPSTWLNAFVDKVFVLARTYNPAIALGPICTSLNWLLTQQNDEGYFVELQRPLHREMHGGVGGRYTLTAYVVVSLLESRSYNFNDCNELEEGADECNACNDLNARIDIAVNNAINFLEQNKNRPVFTGRPFGVSILSYALNLYQPDSDFAVEIYNRLGDLAGTSDNRKKTFWKGRPFAEIQGTDLHAYWYQQRPEAIDIEATSYALLSTLKHIESKARVEQRDFDATKSIALWLICQRNNDGAFFSTQDTVMGLQALSAYQTWFSMQDSQDPVANINFVLTGKEDSSWAINPHIFNINENDQNFRTSIDVPNDVIENGAVSVFAAGEGQGQISYKCVYRTTVDEESCHFNLHSEVQILNEQAWRDGAESLRVLLTVTVSKPVGRQADSSILDVGLISGFSPTEASLTRIKIENNVDGVVDRFEVSNQNIIFYLPQITNVPTMIAFELVQRTIVRKPQPSKINVYDYYEPSIHCGKFYSLPGSLEQLRTTGCGDGDAMCKCAEGSCPVCRPREAQLNNTVCIRGGSNSRTCHTCPDGQDNCVNLFKMACDNNFAYIVDVTSSPQLSQDGVFTSFSGVVRHVLREGEEPTASVRDEIRKFDIREDCYAACQDSNLAAVPGTGNFIRDNFDILVMGNNPEKVTRNGVETRNYVMKGGAVIERIIPQPRCDSARNYIRAVRCNNNNVVKSDEELKRCKESRATNTACRNLEQLIARLDSVSCD